MVIIKRLYSFMLQRFVPLLLMTFFICLFIVLMQFLWVHIKDLVGKGLDISTIAELFFYAALSMVPLALPLSVLLASLMVFGNLGEKFELTAIKAAGISLFRIMRPLIIFIVLLSIGAFFFQNNVLPIAQTKMWTLLFSMRQKSPEVEIPERSFYDQIPGMNLYVDKKNQETGMLYDLIIYDLTRGLENARVILADSGKLNFTEDKTHLFLHLYKGEMFENLRENDMGASSSNFLPFRRESFSDKQIYFVFDANFNRIDESTMRSQYIGKNMAELTHSIDSIKHIVDSIGTGYAVDIVNRPYVNIQSSYAIRSDSGMMIKREPMPAAGSQAINLDSVFKGENAGMERSFLSIAINKAKRQRQDYEFRSSLLVEQARLMRRHDIERQKRFTLSVACLIFFFIGAPLGAIIKKGGLGTPMVISVLLFIIYYIFDNMGNKMARDDKLAVWQGIWLSTAILLPLGIFFTIKAAGDSQVFNIDAITRFFNALLGKRVKRNMALKEVIINEADYPAALATASSLKSELAALSALAERPLTQRLLHPAKYAAANALITHLCDNLANSRQLKVLALANEYPMELRRKDIPSVEATNSELINLINNYISDNPQPENHNQ